MFEKKIKQTKLEHWIKTLNASALLVDAFITRPLVTKKKKNRS
jgi:hypothetical protein